MDDPIEKRPADAGLALLLATAELGPEARRSAEDFARQYQEMFRGLGHRQPPEPTADTSHRNNER